MSRAGARLLLVAFAVVPASSAFGFVPVCCPCSRAPASKELCCCVPCALLMQRLTQSAPHLAGLPARSCGTGARRLIAGGAFGLARSRMSLFPDVFSRMRGGGAAAPAPVSTFPTAFHDAAPSWVVLDAMVKAAADGKRLHAELAERSAGGGPAHCKNKLRLFGKTEKDVRVVLYRDHAGWCPYCQKVWLLLEEKQMPYRIEHINMRSYGDKPDWFLKKNPSGMLPVVEIDGQMHSDSIRIMQLLDQLDDTVPMLPRGDKAGLALANELMQLERQLFGAWCSYVFQPMTFGRSAFEDVLTRVDRALQETEGPWFLGGSRPSIVDLQYVSHVERMAPSVLYWKGLMIRGGDAARQWPGLHRWLAAFEERQPYVATKSDYYTHITDIPPQYGPGQSVADAEAYACKLDGREGWQLPLPPLASSDALEPVLDLPLTNIADEAARVEAAMCLVGNSKALARFCARAAGPDVGAWRQQGGGSKSALADPYAKPNDAIVPDMDACLRHVAHALLQGVDEAAKAVVKPDGPSDAQKLCLDYLCQRISVPRDMSYPAARQLRAHLNWMADRI